MESPKQTTLMNQERHIPVQRDMAKMIRCAKHMRRILQDNSEEACCSITMLLEMKMVRQDKMFQM